MIGKQRNVHSLLTWVNGLRSVLSMMATCSVAKSCLTLHDHMDCSTPGFLVPHHLLEFAQVYVHGIRDAIQPSHPLSPRKLQILWVGMIFLT